MQFQEKALDKIAQERKERELKPSSGSLRQHRYAAEASSHQSTAYPTRRDT